MSSEPRLVHVVEERPLPKFYVFYEEWSGEIKSVSNKLRPSKYPYLHTDDKTASDIMLGLLDPKRYVVFEGTDQKVIIKKDDVLRVKQAEDVLTQIPVIPANKDVDINIVIYQNDYFVEINLSQDTIYKLTGRRFNRKFNIEENVNKSKIELFFVKSNNPFYLYKKLIIDPISLVNDGFVLYDFSDLKNKISMGDISVLTRRVFKDYGIKYKQNYVTVDYHSRKSHRREFSIIEKAIDDKFYTFSVKKHPDGWLFKSNFDNPTEQRIYRDINFYLTDGNPFILLDSIQIPLDSIGMHKTFLLETDVDLASCYLLLGEEGKYINFCFEEQTSHG